MIREFHDQTNNYSNNDNNNNKGDNDNNNTCRQNECNCKTRKMPYERVIQFENVVYQGIIYPKENVKNTMIYIGISSTK